MTDSLRLVVDWVDAEGVTTPELAATWARWQLWVGDRCVTDLRDAAGDRDRAVDSSLYPLAEWVAEQWWRLRWEQRVSAVRLALWSWPAVRVQPWLRAHNLRAAGDGMAWPNLTLVPEGSVFRCAWFADAGDVAGSTGATFTSEGTSWVPRDDVEGELARLVELVLARLEAHGLHDTYLAKEWREVQTTDAEEAEFCVAAARLGHDPYSAPAYADEWLPRLADLLPGELLDDFLDSADPAALKDALGWLEASRGAARRARRPTDELDPLRGAAGEEVAADRQPWARGYALARRVRPLLAARPSDRAPVERWVASTRLAGSSFGLEAYAAVTAADLCRLVVPEAMPRPTERFAQARALGRALTQHPGTDFLLTPARGDREQQARAFAAELLAPAAGIELMLDAIGHDEDAAVEAVAGRYGVSPLLVRWQIDNQLASAAG